MKYSFVLAVLLAFLIGALSVRSQEIYFYIFDLEFSPDHTLLAIAGGTTQYDPKSPQNYGIRLVDAQTYDEVTTLLGHTCSVDNVAWDPTSRYLVSGSADQPIVWDIASGTILTKLYAPKNFLTYEGQIWNPHYDEIIGYNHNQPEIYVWHPFTGEQIRKFSIPTWVSAIAWDLTGEKIFVGGFNEIYTLDRTTGAIISTFDTQGGSTLAIEPNPKNDDILAIALVSTPELILFNHAENALADTIEIDGLLEVKWSANGKILALRRTQDRITLWDTVSQSVVGEFQSPSLLRTYTWKPNSDTLLIPSIETATGLQEVIFPTP